MRLRGATVPLTVTRLPRLPLRGARVKLSTGLSRRSRRLDETARTSALPGKRTRTYMRFRGFSSLAKLPSAPVMRRRDVRHALSLFTCSSTAWPASGLPSGPASAPFTGTGSP